MAYMRFHKRCWGEHKDSVEQLDVGDFWMALSYPHLGPTGVQKSNMFEDFPAQDTVFLADQR